MKLLNISIIAVAQLTLLSACVSEPKNNDLETSLPNRTIEEVQFTNPFKTAVESFSKELIPYKDVTNVVGYIRILKADDNTDFKISIVGIDNDTLFKYISVDDYFTYQGIIYCVDYNLSNLKGSTDEMSARIIEKSGLSANKKLDVRFPAWLIGISDNKIIKINKKAFGPFFSETLQLNEWEEPVYVEMKE